MEPETAIELCQKALYLSLLISAPLLGAGMLVALVMGLLQALTQIQEQTVAFVPKLIVMAVVLTLTLPWLLMRLIEFSTELITSIPQTL